MLTSLLAIKIAKERKSSVLASNAVHHRIDSLTSIVALTAILGSNIFNNIAWLDPVGGLLVSLMVIRAGWANTGNALLELADVSIDNEVRSSVYKAASKALSTETFVSGALRGNDVEVREIQGTKAGQNYLIELKLGVPESIKLRDTLIIEGVVRQGLESRIRGLRRVKVKFVPKTINSAELPSEFVAANATPESSPEPEQHDVHSAHGHPNGQAQDDQAWRKRR